MLRDLTQKRDTPSFASWVTKLTDKLFNNDDGCDKHRLSMQQMTVLKSLQDNKYNIIKGFRCSGLSTILRLNTLYNLLYRGKEVDYHVLFILDSKQSAEYEKNMFLKLISECDEYILMTEKRDGKISLLFDGREITVEFISQTELVRRRTNEEKLDLINVDNAAYISDKETSDSIAILAKKTKANVSIASNPNGENNLFYETWNDSLVGTAPFKTLTLKWYLDDRFNKDLRASSGLQSHKIDNIGMMFEALENHDMITNDWYEQKKVLLGANIASEIDGEFT
jgi:hypothetical protein